MIRIMITSRERIWYTLKCIEAIEKFTESDWEIFLWDDRSQENLEERYKIYSQLVKDNRIAFLGILPPKTRISHNTFGKAVMWNVFGFISTYLPNMNGWTPDMRYFDYLVLIDNDIFVCKEGWDKYLIETWERIKRHEQLSKTVRVVTIAPGGIMRPKMDYDLSKNYGIHGYPKEETEKPGTWLVRVGTCGGSGLWMLNFDYFTKVGMLPVHYIKGENKKHDQLSWQILRHMTQSDRYVAGYWAGGKEKRIGELALHVGHNFSIANYLTWGKQKQKAPGDSIRADKIPAAIKKEEERFKNMTVEEIIQKYSDKRDHQRW